MAVEFYHVFNLSIYYYITSANNDYISVLLKLNFKYIRQLNIYIIEMMI